MKSLSPPRRARFLCGPEKSASLGKLLQIQPPTSQRATVSIQYDNSSKDSKIIVRHVCSIDVCDSFGDTLMGVIHEVRTTVEMHASRRKTAPANGNNQKKLTNCAGTSSFVVRSTMVNTLEFTMPQLVTKDGRACYDFGEAGFKQVLCIRSDDVLYTFFLDSLVHSW